VANEGLVVGIPGDVWHPLNMLQKHPRSHEGKQIEVLPAISLRLHMVTGHRQKNKTSPKYQISNSVQAVFSLLNDKLMAYQNRLLSSARKIVRQAIMQNSHM